MFGAISVGVGAIVGGGILALAGVAFATTGPGAILAFSLNGVIAVLTALSFAELSAAFPQSGGTYTFAKKVMSVRVAFTIGWVVWFASIVAAVLYALGFASFALVIVQELWQADFGQPPAWLNAPATSTGLAIGATLLYLLSLSRQDGGGGPWANVGKVFVFGVLIAGGLWTLTDLSPSQITARLTPFFPGGTLGLIQAMGYTFIALQGFDLIAAVAGEVKDPSRNIPRAMLASLGIALLIYLPLLLVISTVGVEAGQSITEASARQPETIVAVAAENYLGQFGYWLVLVAAILSMLSALQANLFAASRVALAMARDRTLLRWIETISPRYKTPVNAIVVTGGIVIGLLLILPDVASAGAASSLIFLVTFALAHLISFLARQRSQKQAEHFQTPFFPLIPVVGGVACLGLAIFQGVTVMAAGIIAAIWLVLGGILYFWLLARRAQVVDAAAEASDPQLMQLRGRNPLVLVPVANPNNADEMIFVANAIAPPRMGRVMLLSVVKPPPDDWRPSDNPSRLTDSQTLLREALSASFETGLTPETLITIARDPWAEIARVARGHRCESMLLGLTHLTKDETASQLEDLMSSVDCDLVVLRGRQDWRPEAVQRILVPVGGQGNHDSLRARLLTSLSRRGNPQITFLQILPSDTSPQVQQRTERHLQVFAQDEVPSLPEVKVILSDTVAEALTDHAKAADLVILGLQRTSRRGRVLGSVITKIAQETDTAMLMISSS